MTNIDKIINRSQPFLQSSVSNDEDIARKVLESDNKSCVECGRGADDCTLVIRYIESPDKFEKVRDAVTVDNLETVCEEDIIDSEDIAAHTTIDDNMRDGVKSSLNRFEKFLINNDVRDLKYLIGGLAVLTFVFTSLLLENVPSVENIISNYPIVFIPIILLGSSIYYLLRFYKPSFEPYASDRLVLSTGVLLFAFGGMVAPLLYLTDLLSITNFSLWEYSVSKSTSFDFTDISSLSSFVGAYLNTRLIRADKTEILNQSQINSMNSFEGLNKIKLDMASKKDFLKGDDFGTIKWRVAGFSLSTTSFISSVYLTYNSALSNQLAITFIMLLAPVYLLFYLLYREYLYNFYL